MAENLFSGSGDSEKHQENHRRSDYCSQRFEATLENVLKRDFAAEAPDMNWGVDTWVGRTTFD
ncbi:hypothetical protein GGP96_002386 [Salinibacter ruber]|uniref:Uncharacterized protein n=1 Tax=Salinibacter ruber TaxID=146919 RepID=A0A9X2U4F1_9BACT|nr:hypothetical protein [Salinibacter ruber]MCS3859799.1 hypothetical protein [Salinibacter ruber]MCS3866626.1 hypothetical protein [Salinibacter ruber]MCS4151659.1 hypothetical protein [Salinibacter ruber]MCS4177660.1 hypothetical protein [Salinibacter ruber]